MKTRSNLSPLVFLCLLLLALSSAAAFAQAVTTCTYSPMATIPAGNRTVSVLAVDLNNDGVPDIVATNQGGMDKGTITVALGLGKGKFAAPTTYTLGDVGPYETIAADFNGDGYLDLAVVLFGTSDRTIVGTQVDVFINTGKGTFKPFVAYATGTKPRAVIAADLNKDGKLDLIVANSTANTVGVLLGKGDGTFGPRVDYPAGNNPHGLAVADFNHDGRLDVAVANNGPVGAINVMFGKGDGTLEAPITYSAGAGTFGLAAGDLNGDSYPDIVTSNQRSKTVSVLINAGDGTFKKPVELAAAGAPVAIDLADMNGDGNLDILSSSNDGGVTEVFLGNGEGTFQAPISAATGDGSYGSAVADFDGDGTKDIAAALTTGSVSIMKGSCKPAVVEKSKSK